MVVTYGACGPCRGTDLTQNTILADFQTSNPTGCKQFRNLKRQEIIYLCNNYSDIFQLHSVDTFVDQSRWKVIKYSG